MAFNAGGSNVKGVHALEQGELSLSITPTTFSVGGGETKTIEIAVPVGEKWIIKGISTSSNTFVGTQTYIATTIKDGANTIQIEEGSTGNVTTLIPNQLVLSAGQIVRIVFITSAWTSGQKTIAILYNAVTI